MKGEKELRWEMAHIDNRERIKLQGPGVDRVRLDSGGC